MVCDFIIVINDIKRYFAILNQRKIGFRLSGFRDRKLEEALGVLADAGYDSVELCLEHPELYPQSDRSWDVKRLYRFLRNIRLEPSAVSFHGKQADWEEKKQKCRAGLQVASELEVSCFISGSVQAREEDKFGQMCVFTAEMCRAAEVLGVFFAVEPEPGTIIHGTPDMRALMKAVDSPWLKINFDVGHSYITEEDLYSDIVTWGEDIIHVHLEDIRGKEHRHLLPGQGEIDFRQVLATFNEIAYYGAVTVDLFDIYDNPEMIARLAITELQKRAKC